MMIKTNAGPAGLVLVALLAGVALGWHLHSPVPAKPEPPAPEIRQPDGSVVLRRAPDAKATQVGIAPKGAVLERNIGVTAQVKPDTQWVHVTVPAAPAHLDSVPVVTCPPLVLNLSIDRMPDNTRRVVAKSPNGTILDAIDIPVTAAPVARRLPWSAGVVVDPVGHGWGPDVTRDFGPFRVVASVMRTNVNVGGQPRQATVGQVAFNLRF